MEIRHHTESSIQALLSRARRELKVREHLEMLERFHKYMRTQGYSLDTIYIHLNRSLLFLNYVEALGKTIDEITLDEIQDYLSTRGKPATKDDLKGLEAMFRSYLKESLETIKDYIVKKLKEEKKDPKEVSMRVRRMVKRLRKQDCFKLLERDEELRKLIEVLDILTV